MATKESKNKSKQELSTKQQLVASKRVAGSLIKTIAKMRLGPKARNVDECPGTSNCGCATAANPGQMQGLFRSNITIVKGEVLLDDENFKVKKGKQRIARFTIQNQRGQNYQFDDSGDGPFWLAPRDPNDPNFDPRSFNQKIVDGTVLIVCIKHDKNKPCKYKYTLFLKDADSSVALTYDPFIECEQ
jgi:hypothetical protein